MIKYILPLSFLCSFSLVALFGELPLIEYEGKLWEYRDFSDSQPDDLLQKFSNVSLQKYPLDAVKKYLIERVPTVGYLRAQDPRTGQEIIDAFARAFVARFVVAEGIDRVIADYGLRSEFPDIFSGFERAIKLNAEVEERFNQVFEEAASKSTDYESFRAEFIDAIDIPNISIPTRRFWEIYASSDGEVLRLGNKLLPFEDRFGNPSRWYKDYAKNALMLSALTEWIRLEQDLFLELIQEEAAVFEVLHVEFSDGFDLDGMETVMEMLEELTNQVGLESMTPELLAELSEIKNAEWRPIMGVDLKNVAAELEFFEPVKIVEAKWMFVPEKNGAVLLKDSKPLQEDANLAESLKYFDELLIRVWQRLLVPRVVEVFEEIQFHVDVSGWSPEEMASVLNPGSGPSRTRGVSTGWKLNWPKPGTLLRDVFK